MRQPSLIRIIAIMGYLNNLNAKEIVFESLNGFQIKNKLVDYLDFSTYRCSLHKGNLRINVKSIKEKKSMQTTSFESDFCIDSLSFI